MSKKIFAVFCALMSIVVVFTYVNAARGQIVREGLVSYWTFDKADVEGNIAKDIWGNNDGSIRGPNMVAGKIGEGLDFDGADDYVDCGSDASLDNLGPLTVEAWIYPRTIGESYGRIYEKVGGAVFYLSAKNSIQFAARYQTTDMDNRCVNNLIIMNTWQHVAVTWDGSSDPANVHIYVNGTEATYTQSTEHVGDKKDDSAESFLIGNRPPTDRTFDGVIDEVKVYKRVLREAEIHQNYSATSNRLAVVRLANKLTVVWGRIKSS